MLAQTCSKAGRKTAGFLPHNIKKIQLLFGVCLQIVIKYRIPREMQPALQHKSELNFALSAAMQPAFSWHILFYYLFYISELNFYAASHAVAMLQM